MAIDWGIIRSAGPVDITGNFARGYDIADKIVSKVHEKNALGYLANNPDDQNALAQLYQANPQLGAHFEARAAQRQKALREQQAEQRQAQLGQLYNEDPQAAQTAAIGEGNFDLAKTFRELGEPDQKKAADFWGKAGSIAYKLRQTIDPAARQALWGQARPMLEAEGAPAHLLDSFDPTNDTQLEAAIATSQKIGDLISQGKPLDFNVEPGGARYSQDPVTGKIRTIIAPNTTGQPMGTPAGGGGAAPSSAPRGERNNNALNLTKSSFTESQPGYAGTDEGGRYARFATPEAGEAAGAGLLASYLKRGYDTPSEIIGRWAPASENGDASTNNYVTYVSQKLGIRPDQKVSAAQLPVLAHAMAEFENGRMGGSGHRVAPHVTSKTEYDHLPSGTPFIAPDGSKRVKP